jgi:methionyl-tRNA synthetase
LPEVPVTFPGDWGVRAPFPGTPGQVFYPWVEAMPASIYATWWSAQRLAEQDGGTPAPGTSGTPAPGAVDEYWRAEHDAELVYFHGYDNVYHWALMDLVFLMAHGDRYVLPSSNVCNEFYDLDGEKFSTSRGHLIWSADLLAEVPRDLVRFYLALTAPEFQRSNFSVDAMRAVTTRRLIDPWNRLADGLSLALVGMGVPGDTMAPLPTTAAGRQRAAAMAQRFRLCYELSNFSMTRAAETVLNQLGRLRAMADAIDGDRTGDGQVQPGDLLLEVRTLLAWAAPILIDVAERAAAAGVDLGLAAETPMAVAAFVLPRLPNAAGTAGTAGTAGSQKQARMGVVS